ncbi:unnamed protein product [Brassica oleracea]|uniref:(rape) hypothetical protein n=1 Tax=Brassica napus TaxID=3708 RepID=A0A816J905_BRANA|nr:unnamed protein product [Brassica napus]
MIPDVLPWKSIQPSNQQCGGAAKQGSEKSQTLPSRRANQVSQTHGCGNTGGRICHYTESPWTTKFVHAKSSRS